MKSASERLGEVVLLYLVLSILFPPLLVMPLCWLINLFN
jgi:hypothetical protein